MDTTALPSELLVPPQPLIGFCGLDIIKNSVHKSIWDAFNNNRKTNGAAVQFKVIPSNYEFPIVKPKRASYEWYHPKGILKRNWMLKHLHVIPAVIVLFQDIEWNDSDWSEKQLQCASLIQTLKHSIQDRNTRLSLVLIQKAAPIQTGDDLIASERAASLATACGISSKMLFILPHTDHLTGYTLRLESAFLEMAQAYYMQMIKHIRMHREQLTASHVILKIRHQFKLGFISEMRSDSNAALKHYSQAYSNLDEIRIVDTNCLEIKTVAGFLNYKICRLMFKMKIPRDSINHFISHVEKYKSRVGFKELLFEHYAWLSIQHSSFADLFCEAIKNDLPALQTQHPGIYYHKAAEYIIKRKEAFLQSSLSLSPTEPLTPTSQQNNHQSAIFTEFFGMRTFKTTEPYSDQQMISMVQDLERGFNHSAAIISLLSQARTQFKTYKCLRFCKKLSIDMAEEYFKSGDHSNALTLYSLMLSDYRQEKWNSVFSDVLLKTLRCAYLSASVADFISCSIEALSPTIRYDQKERITLLENLWKVFQNVPPGPQSMITPELRANWEQSLATYKSPTKIDLERITDIIEGYATFEKIQLNNDERVNINFVMRILTDVPLKVRNFILYLTDGNESFKLKALKYCIFNDLKELRPKESQEIISEPLNGYCDFDAQHDLKLFPDKYYSILFSTEANQFFENCQLQFLKTEIHMGTDRNYAILMKSSKIIQRNFKQYNRYKLLIDNMRINPICYITPTFHLLTQVELGYPQMLINEYFKITCNITNNFNLFLKNVGVSISVPQNLKNKVFLSTDVSPSRQKILPSIQIDVGDMTMQSNTKVTFFVFSLIECSNIELSKKIWYSLDSNRIKRTTSECSPTINDESPNGNNYRQISSEFLNKSLIATHIRIDFLDDKTIKKTRDETIKINCIPEFKFIGRYYSLNRQPLSKIYRGENFLFRANVEVQSLCDLDILETYFICDPNLVQSTYSYKRKKSTRTYNRSETLEDVIVLRTNSNFSNWLTQKDFELSKISSNPIQINKLNQNNPFKLDAIANTIQNKNSIMKIPQNMTIIGNGSNINQNSPMNTSLNSDDGKLKSNNNNNNNISVNNNNNNNSNNNNSNINSTLEDEKSTNRIIYQKALEAIQPAGHLRGFIKSVLLNENPGVFPIFGLYCIKWRRSGSKEENESKFLINGIDIDEPPLNLYCSIEEKIFVKIPMPFKIVFKNPTTKVIPLIATLSNNDNFMCSGHKQLNISVFAHSEKELVFNLYPLKVGWQTLPELNLEYNTQADPSKDDTHKNILSELVQRSMPKKVFVLPASKSFNNKVKT
ncbi:trafficking protein particle complex subunit 11 isoform X2 [Condylostylus longicornis]|uniref:trafficking protein particle complex subunit 11 isoform X2 n=1 Tax=Condylostylus longicornis TaxID=2530218 RepID=UPI00244E383C|nr:trafficking protein particle complex subunit 11 isoform X2 [Condylostylus longicornis]